MMDLDDLRIGYFIVYRGDNSWVSKAITREQLKSGFSEEASKYTHVEVSGGGPWSVGAVMPKSKLINIQKVYKGRYVKVMKYVVANYDERRYKVGWFAATECNLPYGWWTLFWFILRDWMQKLKPWGTKKYPFCSLLAAWALTRVYENAFHSYKTVMPANFLADNMFEVVWEGTIEA